jgi:hypothetical protein
MNFTDAADGRVFTAARLSSDQVLNQLNHLQQGYEDVNQIILERIELNRQVARALARLLKSDKHTWIVLKCVDCQHLLDESDLMEVVESLAVPRLFLQTTPNFPVNVEATFFPIEGITRVKSLRICTHTFTPDIFDRLEAGLAATTTLEELSLSGSRRCGSHAGSLIRGFQNNKALRYLDLRDCQLNDDHMCEFVTALRDHPNLRKLDLSNNLWSDRTLRALAISLLPHCRTLQSLDLSLQRHSVRVSILAPALANSGTSLKQLYLSNCGLEDPEVIALVDALTQNTTLQDLNLSNNRQVSDTALIYLAERLPRLHLLYLNIRAMKPPNGSLPVMMALHEGMRRNTSLLLLRHFYWKHVQHARQIQYYINANRGGRRVLAEPIPLSLWPLVLERAYNMSYFCPLAQHAKVDAIYNLFRHAPALWE